MFVPAISPCLKYLHHHPLLKCCIKFVFWYIIWCARCFISFLIYTLHTGGGWSISQLLFNPPYYFLVYFIFVLLMGRAFFDSVAKSERLMNRVGGEDELFSLKGAML